jgi:hypothetical protein
MAALGVSLAPDDGALVAEPDWERIDTTYAVQSWSIDRGRPNEMSRTDTGTATVELIDRTGDFDPTNFEGAFFGRLIVALPMGPMVQAAIALQNPLTEEWSVLFRGFIASIQWTPYRSEQHANVTLELVDGFALLAAAEMAPNGTFGHTVEHGDIIFQEDNNLDAVKTRIATVLDQIGWPGTLRSIFTGNVSLQRTVYAPRSTVLSVIQDAADAEFPEVGNVYIGGPRNPGAVVFHGRFARFNPEGVEYGIRIWQAGDDAAAAADAENIVRLSPPLVASIDDTLLYTSALATPQRIHDADIWQQYAEDPTTAAAFGLRTWSAENLATFGGDADRSAMEETKLYADYVRDNFALPRVRVGQLTIKSRRPESVYGPATWELLTEIDISDIVQLTTTHGGGGGFAGDEFYVEGIHYSARPGGGRPYVELTLDVSPRGYYDANPFP